MSNGGEYLAQKMFSNQLKPQSNPSEYESFLLEVKGQSPFKLERDLIAYRFHVVWDCIIKYEEQE